MSSGNDYRFKKGTRSAATIMGVLLTVLIITIPFAIYFFLRKNSANVTFDEGGEGLSVKGLGLTTSRWEFAELERIGMLNIRVVGGGIGGSIGRKLNGGEVAMNFVAITRGGKKLKFMVSRFEGTEAIIGRVVEATGLPLETVSMGAFGPKWPEAAPA